MRANSCPPRALLLEVKPVIVLKSGRHKQSSQAAATHTGALAGADEVYDAAFRRAGLLRVMDLGELFTAAEAMAYVRPFDGRRLGILTNGGGIGVLAVDQLLDLGGSVAELSRDTFTQLDRLLPRGWSRANPVDIVGDADGKRSQALSTLLSDKGCDAVLVLNVPTALASSFDAAQRDRRGFSCRRKFLGPQTDLCRLDQQRPANSPSVRKRPDSELPERG